MTDILCRWLNEELSEGQNISPNHIPELFSSGYLFGSILSKHGMQEDFKTFIDASTTEAKLNNFLRLEPTFGLLNIRFDTNMAHDVMLEKQGVATKLLYQLYVALQRKEKQSLTGQSLRCMKPTGRVMLETMEKSFFQGRMKQMPRQVDLNFTALANKFKEKHRERVERIVKEMREEEEQMLQERKEACHRSLEKSRQVKESQDQIYAKLKPIPGQHTTPSRKTRPKEKEKQLNHQSKVLAEEVRTSISTFEATHRGTLPENVTHPASVDSGEVPAGGKPPESSDYMEQIRKRVSDGTFAQKERERRRRKVHMDQMRALRNQEESHREDVLVSRMLQQCQQEQRIATQLMQVRKEKENIRNNRIELQRQFEERRQNDFEEYLKRQSKLIESEKKERKNQLKEERRYHQSLLDEKAAVKKKQRVALVSDTLDQVLEFVYRICEYKEETGGLLPAKIVRDWKIRFLSGHPLYDDPPSSRPNEEGTDGSSTQAQIMLDDCDFFDYHECRGLWSPSDDAESTRVLPPPNNPVLAHFVHQLYKQVFPPKPPPDPPSFPAFCLRASCVGRPFCGLTALLDRLTKDFEVHVVCIETLVAKAIHLFEEVAGSERTPVAGSQSTLVLSHTSLPAEGYSEESQEESPPNQVDTSTGESEALMQEDKPADTVSEDKGQITLTTEDIDGQQEVSSQPEEDLTWCSLGRKALEASQLGVPIPDHVLVNLIVLHLRELPDGGRYVLANFPATYKQAELLETLLSGYTPTAEPTKYKSIQAGKEGVYLLIDPPPNDSQQSTRCGLDAVIHVNTDSDVCLERGISGGEDSNSPQQVLSGIASFDAAWPELQQFYHQFNNVFTVDGGKSQGDAYEDMKKVLSSHIPSKVDGVPVPTKTLKHPSKGPLKQPSSLSLKQESAASLKQGSSSSLKQSSSTSLKQSSKTNVKQETTEKATGEVPQTEVETKTEEAKLEPEPGSENWQYVETSIPEDVSRALAPKWLGVERLYVTTCLNLFRRIREGREEMYKYYALRRKEFSVYLQRPDVKQEYISQWQHNYNALPDHLRREDVMKSEQHCRVDDLCDKLWDICDERKREAGEEKTRIGTERWLEDRIGVLCNYFFLLIQAEVTRFYETVQLQRDYYNAVEDPTPAEPLPTTQLPLIEMPSSAPADTTSMQSLLGDPQPPGEDAAEEDKTDQPLQPKKGAQSSKVDLSKSTLNLSAKKLVLIPEKIPVPEPVEEKGGKKKGGGAAVVPPPSLEEDGGDVSEAIISHVTGKAKSYITATVAQLTQTLTLPDLPPPSTPAPPTDTPKTEDKGKGKKGKDKGDKTPSKKDKGGKASGRGSKVPPAEETPPTPVVSAEDLKKRSVLEKIRKEEFFSLKQEGERVHTRVDMIQTVLLNIVNDLKSKAEKMYSDMEEWLVQQYTAEVESISKLAEVLREAIEDEAKIVPELTLPGTQFVINEGCVMCEVPPPLPMDTPTEEENPKYFTVDQLRMLMNEYKCISPTGVLPFKMFVDTFRMYIHRSTGGAVLPAIWSGVQSCSSDVLDDHFRELLSLTGSEMISWRRFIVAISTPFPVPTSQDIVDAVHKLKEAAPLGLIGKTKFMETPLWMDEDNVNEGAFNRSKALKELLFDTFVGAKTEELHYFTLLLHLCADSSIQKGIHKALSLITGSPVDEDVLMGLPQTATPFVTCNDCVRLHRLVYQPLQDGEDVSCHENEIHQFFSSTTGTDTSGVAVSEFLNSPAMQTVMASWTKLHLKPLPEIMELIEVGQEQ